MSSDAGEQAQIPPHAQVIQMARTITVCRLIYAAAELGLADHLADARGLLHAVAVQQHEIRDPHDAVVRHATAAVARAHEQAPAVSRAVTRARDQLMHVWLELTAWPEARAALQTLRDDGVRLVFLSNFTQVMLDAAVANAGLAGFFEPHLSTDLVRAFKDQRIPHEVAVLRCGHYSTGKAPFKFVDGYILTRFLKKQLVLGF